MTYTPNEEGLGALSIVEDVRACSVFKTVAERDACMIARGYQKTASGYSRQTGIRPAAIVGVVAAALPIVAAASSVLSAVKATEEKGSTEPTPAATPAPVVVSPPTPPAPEVPAAAVLARPLEPWVLPVLAGGAILLLLALRR